MADRQTRIAEIARGALVRDAAMREAFLRDACQDDRALRLEVDAAIGLYGDTASTELETAPASPATPRTVASDIAHVEALLAAAGKSTRYSVLSSLGIGGMGAVYKASDTDLKRAVAIKALIGAPGATDPPAGHLRKEALAAALLDHPYICKVYELIDTPQGQLIVMEFVEGETLARRLRHGRLSIETTLQWGIEIAEGLADAHERGLVHRDLTPRNVMVTTHGHIKLLDFGLAHPDASNAPTADGGGGAHSVDHRAGTPAYMAPEQAEGRPVTARADVFALGAVLCECLTGKLPFGSGPWADYVARMRTGAAMPIRQLAPDAPQDLARLIDRCLDRAPANRPQSAREVVLELRQIAAALAPPDARRRWLGHAAWLLAAAAALVIAAVAWQSFAARDTSPPAWRSRPFVTSSAEEYHGRISPDKQWVSYLSTTGGATQLFVRRVEGGDAQRVSVPDGTILDQVWSPDGTQLAYVLRQGRNVSLQVVRAFFGGVPTHTIPIELARVEVRLVRWIGRTVYMEIVAGGASLQRVDLDTAKRLNVTESWTVAGRPWGFDVTPDGQRVVFTASSADQEDLWVSHLDGTSVRRLTNDAAFERHPLWIDEGTTLIYQSNRGGQVDLWGMSVESGQPWTFTTSPAIETAEGTSPDGAVVTFKSVQDDSHLWIWDPSSGAAVQLTDDTLSDFAPSSTANGSAVVFQRKRPSPLLTSPTDSTLLVSSLGGDGTTKLQADARAVADGFAARVSPDGGWVAYLQPAAASETALKLKHLQTDTTIAVSSRARKPPSSLSPPDWAEQNMAWSRTSATLYFIEQEDPPALKRFRTDTKTADAPLAIGQAGEVFRDLRLSGDDRYLAYLATSTAGSKLCLLDLTSQRTTIIGQYPASAYLRGWTADDTAVVVVRAVRGREDVTFDVDVLVVPVHGNGVREFRIERTLLATTRLDAARDVLYLTRSDAGIHNVYAFPLATSKPRRLTDNVRPGVTFSGIEPLADGRVLGVRTEHKSDIWIGERDR